MTPSETVTLDLDLSPCPPIFIVTVTVNFTTRLCSNISSSVQIHLDSLKVMRHSCCSHSHCGHTIAKMIWWKFLFTYVLPIRLWVHRRKKNFAWPILYPWTSINIHWMTVFFWVQHIPLGFLYFFFVFVFLFIYWCFIVKIAIWDFRGELWFRGKDYV